MTEVAADFLAHAILHRYCHFPASWIVFLFLLFIVFSKVHADMLEDVFDIRFGDIKGIGPGFHIAASDISEYVP